MSNNYGLQEIIEEGVSATTATPSVCLGTEAWYNGSVYRYVYNKSTSTALVKMGVVYSAASNYSVTISSVTGEKCAGIVVHTDIEPATYGWVLAKGFCDATVDNSCSNLDVLVMGADGFLTSRKGILGSLKDQWGLPVATVCDGAGTAVTATIHAYVETL